MRVGPIGLERIGDILEADDCQVSCCDLRGSNNLMLHVIQQMRINKENSVGFSGFLNVGCVFVGRWDVIQNRESQWRCRIPLKNVPS